MISLQTLFERKLLLVSGKGGTGKSLVSAALAMKAATLGKKVLVVESASREQVPPLLSAARSSQAGQGTEIHETLQGSGVWTVNLNPKECFREYVVEYLGLAQLYKHVFDHRVVRSFLDAIPGLGEIMLLGRMFHTCELKTGSRYDLVIFDAPAFGHFLNLLTTPDAILSSGLIGPLFREVRRVRDFLADASKVGSVLVSIPEELVISETLEFIPKLRDEGACAVLGVLINRFYEETQLESQRLDEVKKPYPGLASALAYVRERGEKKFTCQQRLAEGLKQVGMGDSYGLLPEMGIVKEPLSKDFVEAYLSFLRVGPDGPQEVKR